jgi:hypothetical protein
MPFAYTQTIAGFDYAVYNWLFMGAIVVLERLAGNGKTAPTTALASPTTAWRQQAGTASHA